MVQGQWLLLAACSVESLRIHVPSRGVDSVNQEDLKRAVWTMESTPPVDWFEGRMAQLGTVSSSLPSGAQCYQYANRLEQAQGVRLYIATPEISALSVALLASVVKSLDGIDVSEGWMFCLGEPTVESEGWRDQNLGRWLSMDQQRFTEIHFEQVEQTLRQVLAEQVLP